MCGKATHRNLNHAGLFFSLDRHTGLLLLISGNCFQKGVDNN